MRDSKFLSFTPGVIFFALVAMVQSSRLLADKGRCATRDENQMSLAQCLGDDFNTAQLNNLTHSVETLNKATFYHLGMFSFPERLKMVREAKNFLLVSTLEWPDGDNEVLKLEDVISQKEAETNGAFEVKVLHDWFFQFNPLGKNASQKRVKLFFDDAEVIPWTKKSNMQPENWHPLDFHTHDKQFIVDGRKMFIGGINVGYQYYEGGKTAEGWHDEDLLIEGPAVHQATSNWLHAFQIAKFMTGGSIFPGYSKDGRLGKEVLKGRISMLRDFFYDNQDDFVVVKMKNSPKVNDQPLVLQKKLDKNGNIILENVDRIKGKIDFSMYRNEKYFPPFSQQELREMKVPLRVVYDNPMLDRDPKTGVHYSKVVRTLEYLLKNAKREVILFMPYTSLSKNILRILKESVDRGLKTVVITNSWKSIDKPRKPPFDRGYITQVMEYKTMLEAGVQLYEWQGHADLLKLEKEQGCRFPRETDIAYARRMEHRWPGDTLHTKMVIVDQSVMMVGSDNMDVRSEDYNNEVMALVRDDNMAKQAYEDVYETDMAMGRKVNTEGKLDSSGEVKKLKCFVKHGEAKFLDQPVELVQVDLEMARQLLAKHPRSWADNILLNILFPSLANKIN